MKLKQKFKWICRSVAVMLVAALALPDANLVAQPQDSANATTDSPYDRIWRFAEWHRNDQNDVVQSVLFSGRFQYEYTSLDADEGDHREWNIRRLRLGLKSKLFRTVTLHGEVELNPQEQDPFYVRFTDLYVQWSRSIALELTAGKQGVPFTMDGATSSKELLTIDRSNLANNMWFPQEYVPGISASGEQSGILYHAGVYSGGEANREFGEFSGSAFTVLSLGHDFKDALGADEGLLSAQYVYQDPHPANTFTRQLQHMFSANFRFEDNPWGMRADFSAAAGYLGQSDLLGLMVMPFWNITPKFQVVARETFLSSADPNGVRLASYESRIVPGRGNRYQEVYLGANYYFYGHKLKLQTGAQLADMSDDAGDGGSYHGFSWTTGLRVSW